MNIPQPVEMGDMPGLSIVRWDQNWDGESWLGVSNSRSGSSAVTHRDVRLTEGVPG